MTPRANARSLQPLISAHAVDRASNRCLGLWRLTRHEGEGIHTWLTRKAGEAVMCPTDIKGRHMYLGLLWVFIETPGGPMLKTLIQDGP